MAGNIKGITIEFRGDTTKLDKALREVRKSTKGVDTELRQVNRGLKFNPGNVDLLRQKQTLLNEKISKTESNLKELKSMQKQVANDPALGKESAEYRNIQREIIEAESKLKHFKKELRGLGNVNLKALGEKFKQVGQKMTSAGKTLTTSVTLPLTALGTVAAKKFAEVDKVMQLTNSTMGNTKEQADMLNQAMKSAAASSTFGMSDAAQASLNFARAGLTAKQASDALAPSMALAAGEGGNLEVVSSGLVATINGFHGSFAETGKYADVFANACNKSALDVNSLSRAMSVAAPIFSSAGYSVNDAALYMGVMANNGIEANKAANSLKTGLARLVAPSNEGAEKMKALGISVKNSDGTMKDSVTIQKELHDSFSRLSESEQIAAASAIFGKSQMAPWLALIGTAPEDVAKLNKGLMEEGTAMKMQGDMMSGFAGSIEQLKSGLDVLATSFGEALAPVIQKAVAILQKIVDWFNALSPTAQTVIATVGLIVAAVGPLLIIFGAVASGIGSIISLVGTVGPMIGGLGGAFALLTGPIGLVVAAIAAVIAIGVLLYKNWDEIKARLVGLKNGMIKVWDGIKQKVVQAVKTMMAMVSHDFNAIKKVATTVWNAVKSAITNPISKAYRTVKGIIEKIKGFFPLSIGKIFSNMKLPHFNIHGGKAPWGIGGKGTKPTIDVNWYAKGGIFSSPAIIGVGEAGPEAVVPLDKFWKTLSQANMGGTNIVININGANASPTEIAEEVKRKLIRETNQRRLAWQ